MRNLSVSDLCAPTLHPSHWSDGYEGFCPGNGREDEKNSPTSGAAGPDRERRKRVLLAAIQWAAIAIALVLLPAGARAQIVHDADSAFTQCGNNAACTVSLTVGSGANNILLVRGQCTTGYQGCTIASVEDTTNSAILTCTQFKDATDYALSWICWTAGVPSGPNSVTIMLAGAPGIDYFEAQASSYTGVNQSSPWDVALTGYDDPSGTNAGISETVTVPNAGDWLVDLVDVSNDNGTSGLAPMSPQVQRAYGWTGDGATGNWAVFVGSDDGPISSPGAVTDGWTYSTNTHWLGLIIGALAPAGVTTQSGDPLSSGYKPSQDCNAADYPSNIRSSGDMDKLMQTTGSPSALSGATVCETIYGTQNEWVDFQLHVQAPTGGYSSLSIAISSFTKSTGPGGNFTISNAYRQIIPYKEAYLNIPGTLSSTGGPTAAPGNVAYIIGGGTGGMVPDPLIPFVDPYYHQTTNANPTSVAADNNQSYWFDILIPAAAPSGWYSGTVTVSNNGTILAAMPVLLAVWQWPAAHGGEMPTQPTLPVLENATNGDYGYACIQYYGSTSSCGSFPGAGGAADTGVTLTEMAISSLFVDHRMSYTVPTNPTAIDPSTGSWNRDWKWLLTGSTPPAGTPAPIMSGAKDDSMEYYTPGSTGFTNPAAQDWLSYFNTTGITNNENPFFYAVDEPGMYCTGNNGKNWGAAIAAAGVVHADTPPGQVLVTGNIHEATACSAQNDVDVLVVNIEAMDRNFSTDEGNCGTATYPYCLDRSSYNTWLSGSSNRVVASYFGCQNSGTCRNGIHGQTLDSYYNANGDGTGVSNRAEEWITYLHQQTAELYFSDFQCWVNDDAGCAAGRLPWSSIYHFGNNGDGTLLYPSVSNGTNYVAAPGGGPLATPTTVPSIRFELKRDGIQDYEYLHLIGDVYGEKSFVTNEILTWANSAFNFNNDASAAGSGSHTSFTGDITDARIAIGNAMQTISYPH